MGHDRIVELLSKDPRTEINTVNSFNETPLFIASKYGFINVVKVLIAHPQIDLHIKSRDKDALAIAKEYKQFSICKLLEEKIAPKTPKEIPHSLSSKEVLTKTISSIKGSVIETLDNLVSALIYWQVYKKPKNVLLHLLL